MKERLAGFIVMCALVPLAILGYLLICFHGFFGKTKRARAGVRALDNFVNSTVFNGLAWESVSSHAWRVRKNKSWARIVVWATNIFQKNHCMRANKREKKVVDIVLSSGLDKKTIK